MTTENTPALKKLKLPTNAQEYTPDWLQKLGGRKFVAAVLLTLGVVGLTVGGVTSADQLLDVIKWLWGMFFIGAGIAKAGNGGGLLS